MLCVSPTCVLHLDNVDLMPYLGAHLQMRCCRQVHTPGFGPLCLPLSLLPTNKPQSPKHRAQFTTLILNDYGRSFQTLESLIQWPRKLEHFAFTLRFSFQSLFLNNVHISDMDSPITGPILDRLHTMLEPHQTTLKSLRIGLALTPSAYAMAYTPGFGLPPGVHFDLNHSVIPDFRDYQCLQHLHIASIFTGHGDFCGRRIFSQTPSTLFSITPSTLEELHQEVDRLLAPSLYRITLDVGCEFSLRHCPCFPRDPERWPICNRACPLDRDLYAFLITLARRAKKQRAPLCQIHVNYCTRPFALPMPASDLPEGFNWEWIPLYASFNPWEWLERVKRKMKKAGIRFTYTGLEPVCGVPRTHLPKPEIPLYTPMQELARLRREYELRVFDYEDEMCSEHVWTVVKSG